MLVPQLQLQHLPREHDLGIVGHRQDTASGAVIFGTGWDREEEGEHYLVISGPGNPFLIPGKVLGGPQTPFHLSLCRSLTLMGLFLAADRPTVTVLEELHSGPCVPPGKARVLRGPGWGLRFST